MSAENLPVAQPEEVFEQKNGKDPLKIRVALFFDGTLNNRMNIKEREKDELGKENKAGKKFRKDPSNSYDNGRTNIAIMEPHVDDTADGYDLFYKHYIEGQGTFTHKEDSLKGYAFAVGKSGVPWRAEVGIRKAVESITNDINIKHNQHYIAKLTIDVFGFSRGAATARYAIHVILDGRISGFNDYTGQVYYEWRPLAKRLNESMLEIEEKAVKVQFAGLYDTVLSYVASQRLSWTTNALQQMAVARAKKALHLAAADEHREDFPLHRIVSAVKNGSGEEYFLPGVHSDVGGSYNLANEIEIEEEKNESLKKYMRSSNEGSDKEFELDWRGRPKDKKTMVIHEGHSDRLKQDREDLIAQGWYKPNEISVHDVQWDDFGNPSHAMLTVSRNNIRSAYSNIPLKIMARYARAPDVNLKISSELEKRANIILEPEEDLVKLEVVINDYIAANKNNSKPEDWKLEDWDPNDKFGKKSVIDRDTLKAIRHKHFHFSASKWGPGYKPNFEWDAKEKKYKRKRYYYDA